MTGPALIGLAHGSRDPRSAQTIHALMAAVGEVLPGVSCAAAFLDLNPPDLLATVRSLGAERAVVVPLLFAQAFHAGQDVPDAARSTAAATGTQLSVTPILGMGEAVLTALDDRAEQAGIGGEVVLVAVGSSDAAANAAVVELAATWAGRRGTPVHAAFATCAPRAPDVLADVRGQGREVGIVPLFLAPGLLLDQVLGHPVAEGCAVADVLGTTLAGLVAQRYLTAVGSPAGPTG